MSDKSGQKDPSMEEILSSIRRIITEDNAQGGQQGAVEPEDDDVLELTEEVGGEDPDAPRREPRFGLRGRDSAESGDQTPRREPMLDTMPEQAEDETLAEPEFAPEDHVPEEEGFSSDSTSPYAEEPEEFSEPAAGEEEEEVMKTSKSETELPGIGEKIVSESATAATAAALGQLKRAASDKPGQMRIGGDDVTIAEMVREMMRPMLREWMDQNLPAIVERIVRREIQKLVDRAQDDE